MTKFVFRRAGFPNVQLKTAEHLKNLITIVDRGGRLFDRNSSKFCFSEENDLGRYIATLKNGQVEFLVALAVSGHFHTRTGQVNDVDDLGAWSNTLQRHDFWKALHDLQRGNDPDGDPEDFLLKSGYTSDELVIKPVTKQEKETMSQATTLVAQNKTAATTAIKVKAGQALNIAAIKALKTSKAVPMMVRGYLDHPIAKVLVANIAQAAANYTGNAKALQIAELMLTSAAVDVTNVLDIDSLLDSLLSDSSVKSLMAQLDTTE